MTVDTLVIDRALRGTLFDSTTGGVIFSVSQIEDPALEIAGEQVFATDAVGAHIATFDRSKTATFTATNSQMSLGLMAAQFGSTKTVASASAKIVAPKFEMITVGATEGAANTSITLAETPYGTTGSEIPFIYRLNTDGSINTQFAIGTAASATEFKLATKTITLPTVSSPAITATDVFAIWYDYEAEEAIKIENNAASSTLGGEFDLEVLFVEICNPSVKYYGHVIFPSVKMNPAFTLTFTNEGKHGFGFEAMPAYCSTERKLFHIIVPN
jgi:hypothetical protein